MNLMALAMMIVGVAMSVVSGMVWYVGPSAVAGTLDRLPYTDLLLMHPLTCLGIGSGLLVVGMATKPCHV